MKILTSFKQISSFLSFVILTLALPIGLAGNASAVGPATSAAIVTQPSTTVVTGSAFGRQPVIRIVDSASRTVTNSTVAVVASIATGSGTLTGTTTVNAVAGVATFTNLGISGIAGRHTLRFTPTSLTSAVSGNVTVLTAAASVLGLTVPAAGAVNGEAFTTQPEITIQDAYTNAVNSSATVTATVSAGATLVGNTTATANLGVAEFEDLGINGTPNTPYTITYTITSPSTITTTQSITPTAATQAGLASLSISPGTISPRTFNTDTLSYSVSISSTVSAISFTPTLTSALATATVTATVNGSATTSAITSGSTQTYVPTNGANPPISLVVTAQNGTTSTYQITVTKVVTTVSSVSTKPGSTRMPAPTPTPTPTPTSAKKTTQPVKIPPRIASISSLSGAVGALVTLNGANLTGASVRFNGRPATVNSNNGTQLVAVVPTGATSGVITVLTSMGSASTAIFTVTP